MDGLKDNEEVKFTEAEIVFWECAYLEAMTSTIVIRSSDECNRIANIALHNRRAKFGVR